MDNLQEFGNMKEYNPWYHADGTLVWKKIGEKTGRKGKRKQKKCPTIAMDKIILDKDYPIDSELMNKSVEQYKQTHELIPVFLSFDFRLISGYEQYLIAKDLGRKKVPFQRKNKMNKTERKEFRDTIQFRAIGNKKYPVRTNDGREIYVSMNIKKKIDQCFKLSRKLDLRIEVLPTFKFCAWKNDKKIYGGEYGVSFKLLHGYLLKQIKA